MKKLLLTAVCAMISSAAFSQMMVNGGDFANHPERYNNKPISIKGAMVSTGEAGGDHHGGGHGHPGAPGGNHGAPGPGGHHQAPCKAPGNATIVNVSFKENPNYHGCFFAQGPMATTIANQTRGGQPVEATISVKGNTEVGFLITNFKIGK